MLWEFALACQNILEATNKMSKLFSQFKYFAQDVCKTMYNVTLNQEIYNTIGHKCHVLLKYCLKETITQLLKTLECSCSSISVT